MTVSGITDSFIRADTSSLCTMEELLAVQLPLLLVIVVPVTLAIAARGIPVVLLMHLVMFLMHVMLVPLPLAAITAATSFVRAIIASSNLSKLLLIQTWQDNFLFGR